MELRTGAGASGAGSGAGSGAACMPASQSCGGGACLTRPHRTSAEKTSISSSVAHCTCWS